MQINPAQHQQALTLSRQCIHTATDALALAKHTAELAGSNAYTLQLFDQLIDNLQRMHNHLRWH